MRDLVIFQDPYKAIHKISADGETIDSYVVMNNGKVRLKKYSGDYGDGAVGVAMEKAALPENHGMNYRDIKFSPFEEGFYVANKYNIHFFGKQDGKELKLTKIYAIPEGFKMENINAIEFLKF